MEFHTSQPDLQTLAKNSGLLYVDIRALLNKIKVIIGEGNYDKDGDYTISENRIVIDMELDKDNNVISVEEKPLKPKSDFAITGLYFYDNTVVDRAKDVKKSARGEYEITDLNDMYLKDGKLKAELLGAGYAWFDTGLTDSLLDASATIKTLQNLRASIISCPEQIAYKQGWLSDEELLARAELMKKNEYGKYLRKTYDKYHK